VINAGWYYVPKPLTSGAKADGRFGKQDFVYLPEQDVYRCPSGALLSSVLQFSAIVGFEYSLIGLPFGSFRRG
jgi:hypothetical protein